MRVTRRSATPIVVFILGLLIALPTYVAWPALHARYLVRELQTLQLGRSTFDDADRLAIRIGGTKTLFAPCTRAYCEWEKRIDNRTLPRWWRGPGAAFVISFNVEHGIVVRKNTGFGIGPTEANFYPSSVGLEEQQNWGRSTTRVPVQAGWYTTDRYPYWQFRVKLTPDATPEDRQRYTAYNYSCFWKYRGCLDARDLLPAARALAEPTILKNAHSSTPTQSGAPQEPSPLCLTHKQGRLRPSAQVVPRTRSRPKSFCSATLGPQVPGGRVPRSHTRERTHGTAGPPVEY